MLIEEKNYFFIVENAIILCFGWRVRHHIFGWKRIMAEDVAVGRVQGAGVTLQRKPAEVLRTIHRRPADRLTGWQLRFWTYVDFKGWFIGWTVWCCHEIDLIPDVFVLLNWTENFICSLVHKRRLIFNLDWFWLFVNRGHPYRTIIQEWKDRPKAYKVYIL